jgi:hypothetical protein
MFQTYSRQMSLKIEPMKRYYHRQNREIMFWVAFQIHNEAAALDLAFLEILKNVPLIVN